jgi:hypothetical protein
MKLTDKHRSLIASAFVAAFDHRSSTPVNKRQSLCCAPDALDACAVIVGKRKAGVLWAFFYESLGCAGYPRDPEYHAEQEQYYLDKISAMETL